MTYALAAYPRRTTYVNPSGYYKEKLPIAWKFFTNVKAKTKVENGGAYFIMKTHKALNKYFLFIILSSLVISSLAIISFGSSSFQSFFLKSAKAQNPITLKDLVTYSRQSSFIKEFQVPLAERGLKGIATDSQGNAWFYHSTDKASTIIKLDIATNKFT
jgi:hypothetical protein